MRMLWIKADKLLPIGDGGNIRAYHSLRYVSSQHEVAFYSYYGLIEPEVRARAAVGELNEGI